MNETLQMGQRRADRRSLRHPNAVVDDRRLMRGSRYRVAILATLFAAERRSQTDLVPDAESLKGLIERLAPLLCRRLDSL
jgi:hypothetical protein